MHGSNKSADSFLAGRRLSRLGASADHFAVSGSDGRIPRSRDHSSVVAAPFSSTESACHDDNQAQSQALVSRSPVAARLSASLQAAGAGGEAADPAGGED